MHQVEIVGSPIACENGVQETWREVADWVAEQLKNTYKDAVRVRYYDLFDPSCPEIPPEGHLPIVYIDGVVLSRGGKINISRIRKRLEELG
jgi:hypothetical protein